MDLKKAFSLIELLVTVGIMAVMISILVPVIVKIRRVSSGYAVVSSLGEVCHDFATQVSQGQKNPLNATQVLSFYDSLSDAEKNYVTTNTSLVETEGLQFITTTKTTSAFSFSETTIPADKKIACQISTSGHVDFKEHN